MNTKGIISACILDETNKLLARHDIPPILTDKVSEAIKAYESNKCEPDANAWVELERMAKKAAMFDDLLAALKRLEVGANTAVYCHNKVPGRFAESMARLEEYAAKAREAIAAVEAIK